MQTAKVIAKQPPMPPADEAAAGSSDAVVLVGGCDGLDFDLHAPAVRHRLAAPAPIVRRKGLRGLGFLCGPGRFCVYSEGGCGSMCWPEDRPATHAAAGAAARGALIFCFGDCFTCPEFGNDTELFHPRRRAVFCEAALRILSNGESCPPCGGDSGYFHSACAK